MNDRQLKQYSKHTHDQGMLTAWRDSITVRQTQLKTVALKRDHTKTYNLELKHYSTTDFHKCLPISINLG